MNLSAFSRNVIGKSKNILSKLISYLMLNQRVTEEIRHNLILGRTMKIAVLVKPNLDKIPLLLLIILKLLKKKEKVVAI
jgi:hypothetical protein